MTKIIQTYNLQGVEIFSAGVWKEDKYTIADLNDIVSAFPEVGFEPPLKLGHHEQDGEPAIGWVDKVYVEGEKLIADFKDIPQKVYDALKRKNYKTISSEIYWDYVSDGKKYNKVLRAVALLGADVPAVTNLETINNLYKYVDNNITQGGGNMDMNTKMYDAAMDENARLIKKLTEAEDKDKEKEKELTAAEEEKKKIEEEKKKKEAELAAEKEEKKELEKKLSDQDKAVKVKEVDAFMEKHLKSGQILPKFKDEVKALLFTATDTKTFSYSHEGKTIDLSQVETIKRIFEALPKMIDFAETAPEPGDDGGIGNPGEIVDSRVKAILAKDSKKTYSLALTEVLNKDKALKEAYIGG